MAAVKRCGSIELDEVRLGFGCVKYTRGLGRKRIVISSNLDSNPSDSPIAAPLKRQCSGRMVPESEKSVLESLPQDLLIKVLCGVEHEDLEQLSQVSRTIREATLIAKKWHFAYTTPTKTRSLRTSFNSENQIGLEDIETPRVPLRTLKKRICRMTLAEVSTVLFSSDEEDESRNERGLFA